MAIICALLVVWLLWRLKTRYIDRFDPFSKRFDPNTLKSEDEIMEEELGISGIELEAEDKIEDEVQRVELVDDVDLGKYDMFVDREEEKFDTEPKEWDEYIGQEETKEVIQETLDAVRKDGTIAYPHILVAGNAGYGKSCLIHLLSKKSGFPLIETTGAQLDNKKSIYELLDKLPKEFPYGIIFIDEGHTIDSTLGNILLPITQNFKLHNSPIPYFTLAMATTDLGKLNRNLSPLVDRCKQKRILRGYTDKELAQIINNQAVKRDLEFTGDGLIEIASRSRETPRIALGYLDNLYYYALYNDIQQVSREQVIEKMERMRVHENGITDRDIHLMKYLTQNEKPVGRNTITQVLNVDKLTYSNSIEPYLIREEYIGRTSRGRVILDRGIEYLKERGEINDSKVQVG